MKMSPHVHRWVIYGASLIADGDVLLTHCNAGALATAGSGTALVANLHGT